MKRSGTVKFPNSVQLFKFCQKVLSFHKGSKVRDQEVGSILNFNPSDCSHWKRGEKSVRSVFSLAKLAEAMQVEISLVHDVASGAVNLDEAYFEFLETRDLKSVFQKANEWAPSELSEVRTRVQNFVEQIHRQGEFSTPPLYLPEVMRFFSFISTTPIDMIDKLSRILRTKPNQYCIHFRKGDLKPQTRMSMVKDLARILFQGERARFPELGTMRSEMLAFEEMLFVVNLLIPKNMMQIEMSKLDTRKNMVAELAATFWVPKSIVCLQLQEMVRGKTVNTEQSTNKETAASIETKWVSSF